MKKERKCFTSPKKIVVFVFEGKNNKTEKQYFSHFEPYDDSFILKRLSAGVTDIQNMVKSAKEKRKEYDYHPTEDQTYIFVDADNDMQKMNKINEVRKKLPKDIHIIVSNPTFELWFLNHFIKMSKEMTSDECEKELKKYIINYDKSTDYYDLFEDKIEVAIKNSDYQKSLAKDNPYTEVVDLFDNKILKKKIGR